MGYKTHDAAWHAARAERNLKDHQCTGKLRHEHMLTALHHAVSLRRKTPGASISMYVCEYCGFIHVGNNRDTRRELTEDHET